MDSFALLCFAHSMCSRSVCNRHADIDIVSALGFGGAFADWYGRGHADSPLRVTSIKFHRGRAVHTEIWRAITNEGSAINRRDHCGSK